MTHPSYLPTRIRTSAGQLIQDEQGRVTVFVVTIATVIIMFGGLVFDGGLALSAKVRAIGEAQEAARAGAQAIDLATYRATDTVRLMPAQARALALSYLASAGSSGSVTVAGDTVTVTVTAAQATQLLRLVGVDSIPVTGSGSAVPQQGA